MHTTKKRTVCAHLCANLIYDAIKRLDTMMFLTNLDLPTTMVDADVCTRHVLNTRVKEEFMRFTKRTFKPSHEYAEEKYVYSGKGPTQGMD